MKANAFLTAICLFFLQFSTSTVQAQDYNYRNYLYNSSPSLQASQHLAGQVDGWFKDMDRVVEEYQQKYPNGNPAAEARGRAFLSGIQGAYQIQEDASHERRKTQLKQQFTDTYNKAKAWRDYYNSLGYYQKAHKMQQVMDAYNPKDLK